MNIAQNFHNIEKQFNLLYPASFYRFIDQFAALTKAPDFDALFPRHNFFSAAEFQDSCERSIWNKFLPFFVVKYDGFEDCYCFEKVSEKDSHEIIVLSSDGIVNRWEDGQEFLQWLESKISTRNN